jgi:hypothetical protein
MVLSREDLGKLYRADVSQLGKALQEQSKMASKQLIEVGKTVRHSQPYCTTTVGGTI